MRARACTPSRSSRPPRAPRVWAAASRFQRSAPPDVDRVVLVAVGGGVGSALRYLTNGLAVRWLGLDFPYGTLIVNVAGSFLIGLVQALAEEAAVLPEPARLFLSVGVMGGFTTYSAISFETMHLVELDASVHALAYAVGMTDA